MELKIQSIGTVKSPVKNTDDDTPHWGKVISEIHIDPALEAGLKGLEDWSHIVVIYHMHEVEFDPQSHLVLRPIDREDMPQIGIFAQRSRFYPNSIGISAVKVLGVEGNVVQVKGLDAIDGTPVLAIKPYAPAFDAAFNPSVPAWFIRVMQGYF